VRPPLPRSAGRRLQQFQHVLGGPVSFHHPPSSAPTSSSATALITANWEAFFSGKTSAASRITLLQNGRTYAAVIRAQSGSSLARSVSATVIKVTVISLTHARVTYNVLLGTTAELTGQSGVAVYQDGTWNVGDASFCGLLALENGGKARPCAARPDKAGPRGRPRRCSLKKPNHRLRRSGARRVRYFSAERGYDDGTTAMGPSA